MVDDFRPDAIEDGLWVGRAPRAPEHFAALRDLGVQDVLTLQTEDEARALGVLPELAFRIAVANGMAVHRVGIPDLAPSALRARIVEATDLLAGLRARGRRVFVHCAAGLNRSPTVVAAYLARSRDLSAEDACRRVVALHPSLPDREAVRQALRAARDPGG